MTIHIAIFDITTIVIVISRYSTHDRILITRWLHNPIHATIIETPIAILVEYIISVVQHAHVRLKVIISISITVLAILSTISAIVITIVAHLIWQRLLLLQTTTIVTKII